MFHICDGNYRLQVWFPYIDRVHPREKKWHICVGSFILNTNSKLVELFTTMMDINKWVSPYPTSIHIISKVILQLTSQELLKWFFTMQVDRIGSCETIFRSPFSGFKAPTWYLWNSSSMSSLKTSTRNVKERFTRHGTTSHILQQYVQGVKKNSSNLFNYSIRAIMSNS